MGRVNAAAVLMVVASKGEQWMVARSGVSREGFVKMFAAFAADRRGWGGEVFEDEGYDDEGAEGEDYESATEEEDYLEEDDDDAEDGGGGDGENDDPSSSESYDLRSNRKRCNTFPPSEADSPRFGPPHAFTALTTIREYADDSDNSLYGGGSGTISFDSSRGCRSFDSRQSRGASPGLR